MSTTAMLTGDNNAVKLWEMEAWEQAMQQTVLGHAFNRGIVYFAKDLMGKDAKGDQLTFSYVGKLINNPIGEGGTARGNEEALDLTSHNMKMNVSRIPVASPAAQTIEQQRTHIDFNEQTRKAITKRAAELLDASLFMQLAGSAPTSVTLNGTTYDTAAKKLHIQGHNTPVAPSTNRILRAAAAATDQALTSADKLTLPLIDYALELNARQNQPMASLPGDTFDLFISPEQMVDLQHDATSAIQWYNIELNRIAGGSSNAIDTPFKNGMTCAGKYKNVYIYQAPRVAYGQNSSGSAVITTVRRAVLCGADAVSFASPFGGRPTDTNVPIKFFEELVDLGYYKSQEGRLLYGLKKMIPDNKEDIGVTVISTYAAAHT